MSADEEDIGVSKMITKAIFQGSSSDIAPDGGTSAIQIFVSFSLSKNSSSISVTPKGGPDAHFSKIWSSILVQKTL